MHQFISQLSTWMSRFGNWLSTRSILDWLFTLVIGVVLWFFVQTYPSVPNNWQPWVMAGTVLVIAGIVALYWFAERNRRESLAHSKRQTENHSEQASPVISSITNPDTESPHTETEPQSSVDVQSTEQVDTPLWERIPDYRWDRQALKYWWDGFTAAVIAQKIGGNLSTKTVTNRISILRQEYGTNIVPTDEDRMRMGLFQER